MSQIGVSFTPSGGSPVYNFVIDNFGGTDMPRTYMQSSSFTKSANGANIIEGAAYRQKYQWAISTIMETTSAVTFDAMFVAWDTDRADGLSVAVGVTDETFGPTVNTSAVFATPPSYVRLSPVHTLVSFGLMEV